MRSFSNLNRVLIFLLIAIIAVSCKSDRTPTNNAEEPVVTTRRKVPKFDHERAYANIAKQVEFGPRYPGTEAHGKLIDYLSKTLESYTDQVIRQEFKVDFLDEKNISATNIIGIVNPGVKKRMLLCAHFDTRKIAEKDEDATRQDDPILGADDGGSGVGIILEIAKIIKENGIDIGIDYILFDAEDNGDEGKNWCLGSEYWAKNPHTPNYTADFGILLDLVGAKNAEFGKEDASITTAKKYVDKIWTLADRMSYGNYFMNVESGPVMDDHVNIIRHRRIPMIDIINMSQQNGRTGFDHYHHTHKDNMDIIDKNTVRAVGKVVTAAIYNYNNGTL